MTRMYSEWLSNLLTDYPWLLGLIVVISIIIYIIVKINNYKK